MIVRLCRNPPNLPVCQRPMSNPRGPLHCPYYKGFPERCHYRHGKKVPQLIREIRKTRCSDLSDGMDALRLVDKGSVNERMRPGIEFKGYTFTVKLLRKQDAVKPCETI